MKIGIVGAGDCIELERDLEYIAVDNGLAYLKNQGIEPKLVIGDFDSLKDLSLLEQYHAIVLPKVKDDTDMHIALQKAIELGYDEIYLFGVTGGRLDHFLSVLNLLYKYQDYKIIIQDDQNTIYYARELYNEIDLGDYKYFSLFSLEDTCVTVKNAKYPLEDYCLKIGDTLCVSNEAQGKVEIIATGGLFIILSNDR